MMDQILEHLTVGFQGVLFASAVTLPVAAVVALIDLLFGRYLAPKYRALLWAVVAVRLVLPLAPTSNLSVQNAWWVLSPISSRGELEHQNAFVDTATPRNVQDFLSWQSDPTVGMAPRLSDIKQESNTASTAPAVLDFALKRPPKQGRAWQRAFVVGATIWVAVALALLLRAWISTVRFAMRIAKISECNDQSLIDELLRVCDRLRAGRRPRLKLVSGLSSPLIFGFWRPTLCLPAEQSKPLTNKELSMIMLHEVAHVRRRDALAAWVLTVVRAVHWYNPIAWLAAERISRYSELACDQTVVANVSVEARPTYADMLIRFASSRPLPQSALVGLWFASRQTQVEARIRRVLHLPTKESIWRKLVAWSAIVIVAVTGLTDPTRMNAKEAPSRMTPPRRIDWKQFDWNSRGYPSPAFLGDSDEHAETIEIEKEYDLREAFTSLGKDNTPVANEQLLSLLLAQCGSTGVEWKLDQDRLTLRATSDQHAVFSDVVSDLEQFGLRQVSVSIRIIETTSTLCVKAGINLSDAVRVTFDAHAADRAAGRALWSFEESSGIRLQAQTTIRSPSPHMALAVDKPTLDRFVDACQQDTRTNLLSAPSITLFSSTMAELREESQHPFIVGVEAIKGDMATAFQPLIAVLPEGLRIRVRPIVRADGTLDLLCEITESSILDVDTVHIPFRLDEHGQPQSGVSLQSPNAKNAVVSTGCNLKPGESLLIAAPEVESAAGSDGKCRFYVLTPTLIEDQITLSLGTSLISSR